MNFDTYRAEKATVAHAEALLANAADSICRSEYETLLREYEKLLKQLRRLVRMSDRSEETLKQANQRIREQQDELSLTHRRLASHAEELEERVRARTRELTVAQGKLERLVGLGIALSQERNPARFMEMILLGAKELTHADGGILLTRTEDDHLRYEILWYDTLDLRQGGESDQTVEADAVPLRGQDARELPNYFHPIAHAALTGRTVNVPNLADSREFDFGAVRAFDAARGYHTQSMLAVPLKSRRGEVSGVVVLVNARVPGTGRVTGFSREVEGFVEALASQAAIAHDNQTLLLAHERLFDAVIRVIAAAIDAKSPYTHGHCLRVPELATMIARAACESEDGPFAGFDLSETEWREFHLAGWLHDCGKVTTPEHVIDKATKLETIHNRIHEIRTRFEVILRDLKIAHLEARLAGDPEGLGSDRELQARIAALKDDFAFVAACNLGTEAMPESALERLRRIGQTTWVRHFDDRLGLSAAETERLRCLPARPTPTVETLLQDRADHIVPHKGGGLSYDPAEYGFRVPVPQYLYNHGELYNLSVPSGTLTEEERYKIKEHMIHTIIMLEALPFPRSLARVPEIAGGHHETMIGTGYPRGLTRDEMTVQARILAVADVFEALTASDRPYKAPKRLSEALSIMRRMCDEQRIDAEVFALFVTSETYLTYARRYLQPDQMDAVDLSALLPP